MGEIWGRNGRETAVAEWRWAQAGIVLSGHQLPNYPYKNPAGAVINTWGRDHWYTNIFELGAPAPQNSTAGQPNSTGYYFTRGGTQVGPSF